MNEKRSTDSFKNLIETRKKQNAELQIFEAEQILNDLRNIESRKAFEAVKLRLKHLYLRQKVFLIMTRVAAILFVPLLLVSALYFYTTNTNSNDHLLATQTISNPSGIRSKIILPDGSSVWLNAESTLCYNIPFGTNGRNVKLIGEAFFHVSKDPKNPFRVESGKVGVTVLGTQFNYKSFPEDSTIEVVLKEGKVKLDPNIGKAGSSKAIVMSPGERVVVSKKTAQTSVSKGDIEKYIAWHNGKLIFDECPLSEVAHQLERWFGVDVVIDDPGVSNYKISTTFKNESLRQILDLLELTIPIKTNIIPPQSEDGEQTRTKEKVIIKSKN
jgi:ferric-dicitrate binding protein FerR (iron transport regulator)